MHSHLTARPLVIVGAGNLGMTFGRLFAGSAHLAPVAFVSRSPAKLARAARFAGIALNTATEIAQIAPLADNCVILVSTGDRDIASAAEQIAPHLGLGQIVFHCSGALDSDVLKPCAEQGAAVASAHPMTSFANPDAVIERFAGVFCALEGDALAISALEPALTGIGAHVVRLDRKGKTLYHAGAVLASGYLLAILDGALRAQSAAGISADQAKSMLLPLILTSVQNAVQSDPKNAMSGPLVRGDDAVTHAHLDALAAVDPELARLYAALTRYAAQVLGRADPLGS